MKKMTLSFFIFSYLASAHAYQISLTPNELEKLKQGKQLERVEEIKGEVFPKVTLVKVIPHTPKENMAVFSDFTKHPKFVPNLVKAKVVKKEGNSTDVAFEMHMPVPVSNSKYTTRNTITNEGNNYYLTWDLVKSEQVKATKGNVNFEEFEGKTLFTYITHITPASKMAWIVKSKVVPDVKKTVESLLKYLEKNAGKK